MLIFTQKCIYSSLIYFLNCLPPVSFSMQGVPGLPLQCIADWLADCNKQIPYNYNNVNKDVVQEKQYYNSFNNSHFLSPAVAQANIIVYR